MNATAPPRLDRTGRLLVRVGGLIAVVFIALPAHLFAWFILGFADSSSIDEGQTFATALIVPTSMVAAVVMMLKGSTVWLALGGIGSLVVGCIVLAYQLGNECFVFVGQVALVAASAFSLALGAALRLIARRIDPGGR